MRVAVLADIHGNLPALEAVLAEPDVGAADRVVLLGDIALGPMPGESLDLLASLGERAVWVHGNCEREIVAAYDGADVPGPNGESARAAASLLQPRHRALLLGLPLTLTVDVDGLGVVLFCHATPRRDDEFVLVDSPPPVWSRALAGVEEQVVVVGHTHMPFDRLVDGRRCRCCRRREDAQRVPVAPSRTRVGSARNEACVAAHCSRVAEGSGTRSSRHAFAGPRSSSRHMG